MSDVTIQICDFKTRSKSANKLIDKDSMRKVVSSEAFKKSLELGRILGLATHKSRYELDNPQIPMEDQILTSPYLANCARKVWIDESTDTLMGEFDLLDTKYGKLIRGMLKRGIMIPVSMSVSATADNDKYYIEDLLGVDFTERPDLNARIDKVNFSAKPTKDVEYDRDGKHYISFSQVLNNKTCKVNFSKDDDESIEVCDKCGKPFSKCKCTVSKYKKGVHKEGEFSESTMVQPPPMKTDAKTDVVKLKPVENTTVPQDTPVVTNLNVESVNVENVTPSISFSKYRLFNDLGISENTDLQTTMNEIHKDIPVENQMSWEELKSFPNTMASVARETVKNNFSFKDIVREWSMKPTRVLKKRIDEVVQECRANKQEWIDQNLNHLRNHFDQYMLTWINESINAPGDKKFNIMMGLQLPKYNVDTKNMLRLDRAINQMKKQLTTTGFISKPIQQELNSAYQAIENDIYKYVDTQIGKDKSFLGNGGNK